VNNLHVIFELALLAAALAGGLVLTFTPRLPKVVRAVGTVVLLVGVATTVWGVTWIITHNPVDLNPTVVDHDVIGVWSCEWGALSLASDATFALGGANGWRGKWTRHDWNLDLRGVTGRAEHWRIVRVKGTPVLLRGWTDPAAPWPPECRKSH
jgi:hypothetical protein